MLIVVLCALLGLAVGSFLNVVVWRVPRGESVVSPPSACPACGARIRARDNVPIVSWLVLHGRCRDCRARISRRYPLVELVTALLFAATAWWAVLRPGTTLDAPGSVVLLAHLVLVALAVSLTLIDLDVHRLPDVIVLPGIAAAVVLLALAASLSAQWGSLLRALIGGAVLFVAYFLMLIAYPRGMGFGDVKLAGLIGLYLGWQGWGAVVVGGFAAFLLGGLYAVVLLLRRRAGRGSGIPFGPWMLLGAGIGLTAGESMWQGYLGLFS